MNATKHRVEKSRKEQIVRREEKVNDFKAYITSSEFKEHIEKASDKMNECIWHLYSDVHARAT